MADGVASLGPSGPSNRRVIVWFRRDLRLADHPALVAALRMAPEVIPVYLYTPEEEGQFQPGRCSRWWLYHSLIALDRDLRALGSRLLCFRASESRALLLRLARQLGAQAVLFNHLYDPISMVRDNEVKAGLVGAGIFCQSFNSDILREPWEMLDQWGKPLTCFDNFWSAHCSLPYPPTPPLPIPSALPPVPSELGLEAGAVPLPELGIMTPEEEMSNAQLEYHWQPGSAGAHRLLDEFARNGRLQSFDRDRAKTDRASTSRLSPHIHYGEISVRHIYYVAQQMELEWARRGEGGTSVKDFLRQLGYREYSRYLSFHFPFTHERSLLEHLRAVPWRFDQRLFKAWRQGRTGYPLVDAAMRELWGTGWMHNRMRVVGGSFMVKNLLLPWQWGLKHYWDALLDADLESDALGWQYVAGCMADSHEFSYTIDHHTEAKRFDPDGNYVRRWLPVLARLPAKYIHQPWLAPEHVLSDAGVELGCNYPYPVIGVEESMAALHAADAVVQRCLREGTASGATGPFRPATDVIDAAEAERLFEENYNRAEQLYAPAPKVALMQDRTEGCGTTEDVQSNVVGPSDPDLLSTCQPSMSARAAEPAKPLLERPGWNDEFPPSEDTGTQGGTAGGALSAAPPLPAQLPQGKRRAADLAAAPTSEGTSEEPVAREVQGRDWQQLDTPMVGKAAGSGSGGGSGTGHASMTGALAGAHSLLGQRAAEVPQTAPPTSDSPPSLGPAAADLRSLGMSADTRQRGSPSSVGEAHQGARRQLEHPGDLAAKRPRAASPAGDAKQHQ